MTIIFFCAQHRKGKIKIIKQIKQKIKSALKNIEKNEIKKQKKNPNKCDEKWPHTKEGGGEGKLK